MSETKQCSRCGVDKPLLRFQRSGDRGHSSQCKECLKVGARALTPQEIVALRRLVGLSPDGPTDADRERWKQQEKHGATYG